MGNCLKSTSTDDLTLLNGNRESIDQDPNMHFPVSFNFSFFLLKKFVLKFCVIYLCSEFCDFHFRVCVAMLLFHECLFNKISGKIQILKFFISRWFLCLSKNKNNNKMRRKKNASRRSNKKTQNMYKRLETLVAEWDCVCWLFLFVKVPRKRISMGIKSVLAFGDLLFDFAACKVIHCGRE